MAVHKQDNLKIMNENKWLIWNINELKRENKFNKEKEQLMRIELEKVNEAEAELLAYQNGNQDKEEEEGDEEYDDQEG